MKKKLVILVLTIIAIVAGLWAGLSKPSLKRMNFIELVTLYQEMKVEAGQDGFSPDQVDEVREISVLAMQNAGTVEELVSALKLGMGSYSDATADSMEIFMVSTDPILKIFANKDSKPSQLHSAFLAMGGDRLPPGDLINLVFCPEQIDRCGHALDSSRVFFLSHVDYRQDQLREAVQMGAREELYERVSKSEDFAKQVLIYVLGEKWLLKRIGQSIIPSVMAAISDPITEVFTLQEMYGMIEGGWWKYDPQILAPNTQEELADALIKARYEKKEIDKLLAGGQLNNKAFSKLAVYVGWTKAKVLDSLTKGVRGSSPSLPNLFVFYESSFSMGQLLDIAEKSGFFSDRLRKIETLDTESLLRILKLDVVNSDWLIDEILKRRLSVRQLEQIAVTCPSRAEQTQQFIFIKTNGCPQ